MLIEAAAAHDRLVSMRPMAKNSLQKLLEAGVQFTEMPASRPRRWSKSSSRPARSAAPRPRRWCRRCSSGAGDGDAVAEVVQTEVTKQLGWLANGSTTSRTSSSRCVVAGVSPGGGDAAAARRRPPAKKAPAKKAAGQEGAGEEGRGQEGAGQEARRPKKAPAKKAPAEEARAAKKAVGALGRAQGRHHPTRPEWPPVGASTPSSCGGDSPPAAPTPRPAVAAGRVLVNGAVADKPARLVARRRRRRRRRTAARFVGRGGEKLDAALDAFGIDVAGLARPRRRRVDRRLHRLPAAARRRRVVALDVGHGQLHPRCATTRGSSCSSAPTSATPRRPRSAGSVDVVVADLSFISLRLVIPVLVALCQPGAPMVLLVKPQFEAGRAEVGRGRASITDPAIHERVRDEIDDALVDAGCDVVGWIDSPITGGDGNRELLVHADRRPGRIAP